MYELRMPKFGLTMEEGTITKWYKKEGEYIKKGEPIFEVESEKIVNDVESPVEGYLKKILVKEGETKKVGEIVGLIAEIKEELREEVVEGEKEEIIASPSAKRFAREKGVDLSKIKGSGPQGRITEKDVLDYLEKLEETKFQIEELSYIRKEISKNLKKVYESAVIVTNFTKVDFTNLLNLKNEKLKEISITAILIKILSSVLKKFPKFNAHFDGEKIYKYKDVNIGVATDTERGLIVPVIKNVDNLTLNEINEKLRDLTNRAKENKLSIEETQDSSFTITNLGMMRTDFFTPILNGNEVAILGIGRTTKEVKVDEYGNISPAYFSYFSLSYDHRVIDGADAARFLEELCSIIENFDNLIKFLNL